MPADRFRQFLKEPLPWFLAFGLLIFAADALIQGRNADEFKITITAAQIQSMADKWQIQMGRAPALSELDGLVDDYIREEILYREALKLRLDENDTIVRRRLAQKMSFLVDDTMVDENPSLETLKTFYEAHANDYILPERLSFQHIYFRGLDESARQRANDIKARLSAGYSDRDMGDPFISGNLNTNTSVNELTRNFGNEFVESITQFPVSTQWQGPISSVYGYHLILVHNRIASRQLRFEEISQGVLDDFLVQERKRIAEEFYSALKAQYRIQLPEQS